MWRYTGLGMKLCMGLCVVMAAVMGDELPAYAAGMGYGSAFAMMEGTEIVMDGSFGDWETLPSSYEYNWDNSQNCWEWGVWIDGVCYKTEPGTYSTDVRHKMQMHCDGGNVYLHIVYSRDYGSRVNGNDFQFFVDGQMAAFQVTAPQGGSLEEMTGQDAGVYPVEIRHRDSGLSFLDAEGASGYLRVTEDKVNNEIEIKIPFAEMQRQNPAIHPESVSTVEFYTPNLMYRRISAAGSSTGPVLLGAVCGGIVLSGLLGWMERRRGMEVQDGDIQV